MDQQLHNQDFLLKADREQIKALVQKCAGVRQSPRLEAMTDIMMTFAILPGFATYDISKEFDQYTVRCIQRALDELKACKLITIVEGVLEPKTGGYIYALVKK